MATRRRRRIAQALSAVNERQYFDNAACWLNAHFVAGSASNPADGSALTSWKDLSGNSFHAEDATFGARFDTDIAESEPMVYFNGTDSTLIIPSDAALDDLFGSGGCVIAAILPTSDGENDLGRIFSQGGGNTFFDLLEQTGGACRIRFVRAFNTNNGAWKTSSLDITVSEVNIVAVTYNSSSVSNDPSIYVNSLTASTITEDSTPAGTANSANTITIGNAAIPNKTFAGHMGELIFFKSIPTTAELNSYITYLAGKYGVTLS